MFTISFMHYIKNGDPKVVPWGTPEAVGLISDTCLLRRARWQKEETYNWTKKTEAPQILLQKLSDNLLRLIQPKPHYVQRNTMPFPSSERTLRGILLEIRAPALTFPSKLFFWNNWAINYWDFGEDQFISKSTLTSTLTWNVPTPTVVTTLRSQWSLMAAQCKDSMLAFRYAAPCNCLGSK